MECCRQYTKEAMICIDDKYGLMKVTDFYQINFKIFVLSTKMSYVNGSILNSGVVQ